MGSSVFGSEGDAVVVARWIVGAGCGLFGDATGGVVRDAAQADFSGDGADRDGLVKSLEGGSASGPVGITTVDGVDHGLSPSRVLDEINAKDLLGVVVMGLGGVARERVGIVVNDRQAITGRPDSLGLEGDGVVYSVGVDGR